MTKMNPLNQGAEAKGASGFGATVCKGIGWCCAEQHGQKFKLLFIYKTLFEAVLDRQIERRKVL